MRCHGDASRFKEPSLFAGDISEARDREEKETDSQVLLRNPGFQFRHTLINPHFTDPHNPPHKNAPYGGEQMKVTKIKTPLLFWLL